MLSLQNELKKHLGRSSAVFGVAGFVFPFIAPWYLLLLIATALLGLLLLRAGFQRVLWGILCSGVVYAVLLGYLSAPIAIAGLSASVLSMASLPSLAVAILVLSTSSFSTLEAMTSDWLNPLSLEVAAPSLVCSLVVAIVSRRSLSLGLMAAVFAIGIAGLAHYLAVSPIIAIALTSVPSLGFVLAAAWRNGIEESGRSCLPAFLLLAVSLSGWIETPPRSYNQIFVVLPDSDEAFESVFFKNYTEALKYSGISAVASTDVNNIPAGSLLLLPWLTAPLTQDGMDIELRIATLATERKWTVVAGGEHTNMEEIADRVARMSGRQLLRHDLTVPPRNSDNSGPLRGLSLSPWPVDAILNRGASVRITSLFDKVLLSGDGWWAEPDLREWLWVGDYIWQPGDRTGRLPLVGAYNINGARWIVVGDNSPLINMQIIANPKPLIHLLQMASLWPAFLMDCLVALIAGLLTLEYWQTFAVQFLSRVAQMLNFVGSLMTPKHCQSPSLSHFPRAVFVPAMLLIAGVGSAAFTDRYLVNWRMLNVGESGFDERNFNRSLAKNPSLLNGAGLLRLTRPISGHVEIPNNVAVIFTHVAGKAQIGEVMLTNCWRLGALQTTEGPVLMDAQACEVSGPAQIHLGTVSGAAVLSTNIESHEVFIVLDTGFLSQKAPEANATWLTRILAIDQ